MAAGDEGWAAPDLVSAAAVAVSWTVVAVEFVDGGGGGGDGERTRTALANTVGMDWKNGMSGAGSGSPYK